MVVSSVIMNTTQISMFSFSVKRMSLTIPVFVCFRMFAIWNRNWIIAGLLLTFYIPTIILPLVGLFLSVLCEYLTHIVKVAARAGLNHSATIPGLSGCYISGDSQKVL